MYNLSVKPFPPFNSLPYLVEALECRTLLSGLTGQYFDRIDFAELKLTRTDAVVDFAWPTAPAPGIGADFFSTRWTGQVEAQFSQVYTFHVLSDDGARLWVDGRLIIDHWVNQTAAEKSAQIPLEAGRRYDIRLDHYDYDLNSQIRLSWSSPSQPKQVIPSDRLFPSPTGLRATFFNDADFTGPAVERIDPSIDFNWAGESPDPAIDPDTFSARWTGWIQPQYSQTYSFRVPADADAVTRLWIGGQLLVDSTSVQDGGDIRLEANKLYEVRLDYVETVGGADVELQWSSPSQPLQAVPGARLFAAAETEIPSVRPNYTNSVLNNDRPDPGVIFADGAYWMVHTTGGPNGWPLYRSTDMIKWSYVKHLLTSANKPAFMTDAFWAPEIHKIGSQYVLTGTAGSAQYGRLVIALATAPEIDGPYTVQPTPIVNTTVSVLDSHLFVDNDGRVYLLWKRDSASGTGVNGSIRIREMNATGTAFAPGSVETIILPNNVGGWERNLAEAPWMIRRGGYYYLFYSGAFIDLTYSVGVARSTSPLGPFTRSPSNPILTNNTKWGGPGHGGMALDREGTMWHLYHARYQADADYGRVQMLDRVIWTDDGWPIFGNNQTPSITQQPGPRVTAPPGGGRITVVGDALANQADTFLISRSAADSSVLEIRLNGALTRTMPFSEIEQITLDGRGGNDTLILDHTLGDAIPGAGVTFLASSGIDTVRVIGASEAQTFHHTAGRIISGAGIVNYSAEKLILESGTFEIDAEIGTLDLEASNAIVDFNTTQRLGALNLRSGAVATLAAGGSRVLRMSGLSIAAGARLDLMDNDLILDYDAASPAGVWTGTAYDGITGKVQAGRNGGAWNGSGIVTSLAGPANLRTLGVAEASDVFALVPGATTTWNGQVIDATTVLVKYTWGGDATFDGRVNIDDYGRIDSSISQSGSLFGWFNGDFNYDGKINIDDYGIIDAAVSAQDGIL